MAKTSVGDIPEQRESYRGQGRRDFAHAVGHDGNYSWGDEELQDFLRFALSQGLNRQQLATYLDVSPGTMSSVASVLGFSGKLLTPPQIYEKFKVKQAALLSELES